jgi:transposase-like protein
VPTDVAVLAVLWRLRYKLSLRDVAEMFLTRGFTFTHETVRAWEERFAPLLTARLKARRKGQAGRAWHCDETDVTVEGQGCSLDRAIDSAGTLVDTLLSPTRDMDAAKRFFSSALETVGQAPKQVITAKQGSSPRAIRETLGPTVRHHTRHYLNNVIEQDHRPLKQRSYPMRGFGPFASAARFCSELRAYLRPRARCNKVVALADQRRLFERRWGEVCLLLAAG